MTTTNRAAAEAMRDADAEAATDVTGFGLLGHLHRMLLASGVAAELDAGAIPLMDPRILDLARSDVVPGGTKRNLAYVRMHADFGDLLEPERLILADAQTSGGMLLAARHEPSMEAALRDHGVSFARIGEAVPGEPGRIAVAGGLRA
jgi:selenide,water dikinase